MPSTGLLFVFVVLTIIVILSLWKKTPSDEEESEKSEEPGEEKEEEEPLTRQRIEDCVRGLLEEGRGKPKTGDDVLDLDFYNAVGLDSLDTVELIIAMNTSLGTDIDSEIIEKEGIRNGRELVEMVVKELVVY